VQSAFAGASRAARGGSRPATEAVMRKRIGSTLVFCLLLLVPGVARAQGF
jgi:hypothetical protein